VLPILLHRGIALPVIPFVERVGEVEVAVWANPQIVRSVEQLVAKVRYQHRHLLVGRNGPQLILFIGAGEEVAVFVEVSAVRAARGRESAGIV